MITKPLKRKKGVFTRQQPIRKRLAKNRFASRKKKMNIKRLKHRIWKRGGKNKVIYGKKRRKKMIIVMDHFVPHYDMDTGSRNTYQYLKLFFDMGVAVRFTGYDYT
jgi:hypothetical protein